MGVTITYRGDDDLVLSQVCTDGDIDNTYNGSTHKAIEEAADNADIVLVYQGSDLNMIEHLAALAGAEVIPPYLLDAEAEELLALGGLPMTLSDGDTTASHTIVGGLEEMASYAAAPAGFSTGASQVFLAEAGNVVGFEWHLSAPAITEGPEEEGGEYVNSWTLALLVQSLEGDNFVIQLGSRNGDTGPALGGNTIIVQRNAVTVYSAENLASVPQVVGVDLDKVAGKLRLSIDDDAVVLSADGITGSNFISGVLVGEGVGVDAAYAGDTISATIVAHAADMESAHTAGAVDRYGVEI